MTSFQLFRLLKFNKNLDFIYIFILFSPKIDYVLQVTSFHAKNHIFCIKLWYNNKYQFLNYARKTVEKEKWAGLKI